MVILGRPNGTCGSRSFCPADAYAASLIAISRLDAPTYTAPGRFSVGTGEQVLGTAVPESARKAVHTARHDKWPPLVLDAGLEGRGGLWRPCRPSSFRRRETDSAGYPGGELRCEPAAQLPVRHGSMLDGPHRPQVAFDTPPPLGSPESGPKGDLLGPSPATRDRRWRASYLSVPPTSKASLIIF